MCAGRCDAMADCLIPECICVALDAKPIIDMSSQAWKRRELPVTCQEGHAPEPLLLLRAHLCLAFIAKSTLPLTFFDGYFTAPGQATRQPRLLLADAKFGTTVIFHLFGS